MVQAPVLRRRLAGERPVNQSQTYTTPTLVVPRKPGLISRVYDLLPASMDELTAVKTQAAADLRAAGGYPEEYRQKIYAAPQRLGVRVADLPEGATDRWNGRPLIGQATEEGIFLRPGMEELLLKPHVISHELGHRLMGHNSWDEYAHLPVHQKELEAEAVAFGARHRAGMPVQPNIDLSAQYIARHWQNDNSGLDPGEYMENRRSRINQAIATLLG